MFCPKCGYELSDDKEKIFCPNCGYKFGQKEDKNIKTKKNIWKIISCAILIVCGISSIAIYTIKLKSVNKSESFDGKDLINGTETTIGELENQNEVVNESENEDNSKSILESESEEKEFENTTEETVRIEDYAFKDREDIEDVVIPSNVTEIGKGAFYNCKNLKTIIIKTSALSTKTIGPNAFTGIYKKPTIKVPAKQMKTYKKLFGLKGMSSKAIFKK